MANNIIIILETSLLLLLLTFFISTTAATTVVYDIAGKSLKANTNYYILPVVRGRGGGLTVTPKNKTAPCPLFVAQESFEVSNGRPMKFFPVDYPKQKKITLSTDLNIVLAKLITICVQPGGWRLKLDVDDVTATRYVGIGGITGHPGVETVSNWFKFEKADTGKYDYKIVFCPSVCKFCKVMCSDVGVVYQGGKRFLGFSDQPLLVMFKKVAKLY